MTNPIPVITTIREMIQKAKTGDETLPEASQKSALSRIRFGLGWGALICSPASLLYARFEMIRLLSQKGLNSDFGYEGNIVLAIGTDLPAFTIAATFVILSRLFLGRWIREMMYINSGIILAAIFEYIAAYSSKTNLELCGRALCSGESLVEIFWRLLSGN